ncbi:arginine repressor [Bacillota bacterium Meth-B3]|nr:arginine repressor [Christensenellaceae bacterium]MEA5065851.1 arginine repressor [Eubacteriales bacterium]
MKSARHALILEIIDSRDVETQEELAEQLKRHGVRVTQATVSRDIKELRLLKALSPSGGYKYATAERAEQGAGDRFIRIFSESVLSVASSGHMIVIKTLSGSANAAAEAVDSLKWSEVLGTLAGDNTIFIIAREGCDVGLLAARFKQMMR